MYRPKRKSSEIASIKIQHSLYNDTSLDGIEFLNEQSKRQFSDNPNSSSITTVELDDDPLVFSIKIDEIPSELIHLKREIEILISLNK
jgi:hypothetical protein